MSDAIEMRFELQKVAAYRELCRGVRRSGRENVIFAGIMLGIAYWQNVWGGWIIIIGILVGGELLVGLFKWLMPSAEGFLLDGLVLLLFTAYNLWVMYLQFQAAGQLNPVVIFFAGYLLFGAFGRFRAYGHLRKLFSQRPSAEHMAWFDELTHEIRTADPQTDELALDLPTGPHWKAKLLGTTAFFIALRGTAVWIVGPDDFEILREKTDRGTGWRKGFLQIYNHAFPEFEIGDVTWGNYKKWRDANPASGAA
ncbi:MAG TPA: hypothetical protein VG122_04020 [Gemmata sp.]|jgi:hypothetical protein|nr:hypothetical protein [Gemmata sp.]